MVITLTLVGTAIAIMAAFVVATRHEVALASENTAVGLADPAADTLPNYGHGLTPPTRTDWNLTTVSALADAEDLLDCLECRGYEERELVVLGNSTFAVRWR